MPCYKENARILACPCSNLMFAVVDKIGGRRKRHMEVEDDQKSKRSQKPMCLGEFKNGTLMSKSLWCFQMCHPQSSKDPGATNEAA